MSDIKVGDMVILVHVCCDRAMRDSAWKFASPKTVTALGKSGSTCGYCGWRSNTHIDVYCGDSYAPAPWLKRIPPLEELEGVKTQEPLKEGVH